MNDATHGPGWWVASDGAWYPPEQHPDPAHRAQWAAATEPTDSEVASSPSPAEPLTRADGPPTAAPDGPPSTTSSAATPPPVISDGPPPTAPPPSAPPSAPPLAPPAGPPIGPAAAASPSPAGGAAPKRSRLPAILGAVVVIVLVVAGVVVFAATRESTPAASANPVVLEPVGDAGVDPFTTAVSVNEVTEFPSGVRLVTAAADPSGSVPGSAPTTEPSANGGITIAATTPGLYGGSQNTAACDVEQLTAFLAANLPQAEAWAEVQGIEVDGIDDFVGGLTPVVLTTDTWVTNHGFANGVATPRQAVLQAGTAVLVDDTGVPRTKCACGNPLLAPAGSGYSLSTTTGTPWPGFATDDVTSMVPGTAVSSLDLVDVDNGSTFSVSVGTASTPGVIVAVTGSDVIGGEIVSSQILVSTTGLEAPAWESVFMAPNDPRYTGTIEGVAYGDGAFVAVGGAEVYRSDASGRTWSQVATVTDVLKDVVYADGVWTAVGGNVEVRGPADGVVYQSADGITWNEVATVPEGDGIGLGLTSVAYGNGRWNAVRETQGDATTSTGFTSTDGTTWTETPMFAGGWVANAQVSFDGKSWLAIGYTSPSGEPDLEGTSNLAKAFTSTDGVTWTASPVSPADLAPIELSAVGGEWAAVRERSIAGPQDLATSTDGVTWTLGQSLGLPAGTGQVVALAASPAGTGGGGGGPVTTAPTTTTAPATTTTAATGVSVAVGTDGVTIYDAPTRTASTLGTLAPGAPITIVCQVRGDFLGYPQSDQGSSVWDRLPDGTFVPDYFIDGPKAGYQDAEAGTYIYQLSPEVPAC